MGPPNLMDLVTPWLGHHYIKASPRQNENWFLKGLFPPEQDRPCLTADPCHEFLTWRETPLANCSPPLSPRWPLRHPTCSGSLLPSLSPAWTVPVTLATALCSPMVLVTGFHVTECHPAIDSPGSPAVYILGPVSPAPVMGSTTVVLEKTKSDIKDIITYYDIFCGLHFSPQQVVKNLFWRR